MSMWRARFKMRSNMKPSKIEAERSVEVIAGAMIGPGRAAGEEQAVGAAELDDAPDAGTGLGGAIGRVGALARDFGADRNLFTEVMCERDRCLPEIAISHSRIDCIAAAAEQAGSSSEVLSGPK